MATIDILLAAPAVLDWRTYRTDVHESTRILNAAIACVEDLLEKDRIPKRLYIEDRRMLDYLAARDRRFRPYRDVLLAAFKEEPISRK
jgi:hypothetical protein